MYNPKLEKLNANIAGYISAAIADFHNQEEGIRVTNLQTESEELNPPGIKYNIHIGVQITYNPQTTELVEKEEIEKETTE